MSEDSRNATSSPGSPDGPLPSNSLACQTMFGFGQEVVRANRFRAPETERVKRTSDTSGQSSIVSSATVRLQSCLVSKLRGLLAENGSTEYDLTWTSWDMESGLPICALRASTRRTGDNGCTGARGWPTPDVAASRETRNRTSSRKPGSNHNDGVTLRDAVEMSGWPTPVHACGDKESPGTADSLINAVVLAGWATPRTITGGPEEDATRKARNAGGANLQTMAGWATPAARDHRHPNAKSREDRTGGTNGEQLNNQIAHGGMPNSTNAATGKSGVLGAEFVRWLMGFPEGWTRSKATGTR